MKKRLLALMLTGVMVAGAFAGCGDASKAPNAGAGTKTASAEGVEDWVEAVGLKDSAANPAAPDWSEYNKLISEIRTNQDLDAREDQMH